MTAQVLPLHIPQSTTLNRPFQQHHMAPDTSPSDHSHPATASPRGAPQPDSPEASRGRRRTRTSEDGGDDGDQSATEMGQGPGRKRRRSRKGLDKKFECPHEGCGKSYSRAEHLYRHQLNHNPKQIYYCDFPECHRSFVRQDLCARHRERHTARGSQLLRKDTLMHNANPIVNAAMAGKAPTGAVPSQPYQVMGQASSGADAKYSMHSPASTATPQTADTSPPRESKMESPINDPGRPMVSLNRSRSDESYRMATTPGGSYGSNSPHPHSASLYNSAQRQSSFGPSNAMRPGSEVYAQPSGSGRSVGGTQSVGGNPAYGQTGVAAQSYQASSQMHSPYQNQQQSSFEHQQNFPPLTSLPPPGFTNLTTTTAAQETTSSSHPSRPPDGATVPNMQGTTGMSDTAMLEAMTPPFQSMPMFGVDGYNRSPLAMADDFTAWLFNDQTNSQAGSPMPMPYHGPMSSVPGSVSFGLQSPYFSGDPMVSGYYNQAPPAHHTMAVNSILDMRRQESALSEDRRLQIIEKIEMRFNETDHAPLKKRKEEFLEGNQQDNGHLLSLHMMQTYISSYWVHFHAQIPILHKPTFVPDSCPELLILAMMALGASCLEKVHGVSTMHNCAELANFLAWHLRWEIFMDADFRPPAKLWVFQALLLIEYYEKMYSTRPLHERAHIHHATTLTLMRRGSSLIGRSALDSPPSVKDGSGRSSSAASNGLSYINASGANTDDPWWNHWITAEATRRCAFAAFIMDSIHATMFGHSAVMVAHEMRLPLPCDEALWNATAAADVGRMENEKARRGEKPVSLIEGLKKTLSGRDTVKTNPFGRTILMSGLLNVSWHMNQRDIQVTSLGVQSLGGRDKWRGALTRAFDFWRQDFDKSFQGKDSTSSANAYSGRSVIGIDDENVFESRIVLHHLAHMSQHVDIIDCQIFAGAARLLGRTITEQDRVGAQRRMTEAWAPSARARDATYYALRFLIIVIMGDENGPPVPSTIPNSERTGFDYSARDDFLINRPWVLYFAALIVWSYGYALEGALPRPVPPMTTYTEQVRDMRTFLTTTGGVRAPDDLAKITGRNRCLGLLICLRDMFRKTRWELLHEASDRLAKCVDMLTGEPLVKGT